jgi:hypothetical protein
VHLQKLLPLLQLFSFDTCYFGCGHFTPLLVGAVVANLALALLHALYLDEFGTAAASLAQWQIAALLVEALVMAFYAYKGYRSGRKWLATKIQNSPKPEKPTGEGDQDQAQQHKKPNSFVSNIVLRTVLIVSGALGVIAGRDLLFPGTILKPYVPYDDLYLEWTNAFWHSPPPGSAEAAEFGMEAAFFVGDKYVAQHTALCLLIGCLFKFISAIWIRHQTHSIGTNQALMIWRIQTLNDAGICFICRIFAPAATTAALDLRWHLMCIAYETFILAMYGYF